MLYESDMIEPFGHRLAIAHFFHKLQMMSTIMMMVVSPRGWLNRIAELEIGKNLSKNGKLDQNKY